MVSHPNSLHLLSRLEIVFPSRARRILITNLPPRSGFGARATKDSIISPENLELYRTPMSRQLLASLRGNAEVLGPLVFEASIFTGHSRNLRLKKTHIDYVRRLCPNLRDLYVSNLNDNSIGAIEAVAEFGGRLRPLRSISSAHWGVRGLEMLLQLSGLQHLEIYRAHFSSGVAGLAELLRTLPFHLQSLRLCEPSSPVILSWITRNLIHFLTKLDLCCPDINHSAWDLSPFPLLSTLALEVEDGRFSRCRQSDSYSIMMQTLSSTSSALQVLSIRLLGWHREGERDRSSNTSQASPSSVFDARVSFSIRASCASSSASPPPPPSSPHQP